MKMPPANNRDVKRRNLANTLRCILSCERISQMELSQRLALSWPTILQNVKELLDMGLVQEGGQYESTGFLNDANAAGLAEIYGASAVGDLIYLSLSNSVGGAILVDGALYTGNHPRTGEFGGPLRPLLAQRSTFQSDASYLKYCRYRLEASAVGAALTQVEQFLQTL